jgi:hypothetical protein
VLSFRRRTVVSQTRQSAAKCDAQFVPKSKYAVRTLTQDFAILGDLASGFSGGFVSAWDQKPKCRLESRTSAFTRTVDIVREIGHVR